jgi:8-oxo-dGTP diphosphatase
MRIVAKALIFDNDQRILVLRRSSTHPRFAYHWDFPGGEVEVHEKPDEAVMREIYEETRLRVGLGNLQLVHTEQASEHWRYTVFSVQLHGSRPGITLSREHDRYEWLTKDALLAQDIPKDADDYYLTVLRYIAV